MQQIISIIGLQEAIPILKTRMLRFHSSTIYCIYIYCISFFSITQPHPVIVGTVPLAPLQEDVRSDFCKARHETYPCHMPKVPETQYWIVLRKFWRFQTDLGVVEFLLWHNVFLKIIGLGYFSNTQNALTTATCPADYILVWYEVSTKAPAIFA